MAEDDGQFRVRVDYNLNMVQVDHKPTGKIAIGFMDKGSTPEQVAERCKKVLRQMVSTPQAVA